MHSDCQFRPIELLYRDDNNHQVFEVILAQFTAVGVRCISTDRAFVISISA